jgi:hypothetical protein
MFTLECCTNSIDLTCKCILFTCAQNLWSGVLTTVLNHQRVFKQLPTYMNRADCDVYRLDNANLSEHAMNVICSAECNIASHCIHCRVGKYDVSFQNLRAKHAIKGGPITAHDF